HLDAGRRYQVEATIQRQAGVVRLQLYLDGELLLDAQDNDPLLVSEKGDAALMAAAPADLVVHQTRLSVLGAPLKEDLLATAERHLGRDNYQTAFDLFQEVAESGMDPERRARARDGLDRARRLLGAADKLTTWRAELSRVWHNKNWSLDLSESVLSCSLGGRQFDTIDKLRDLPLNRLTLYRTRVADLGPLRDMPLTHLRITGGAVTDLAPLRGLPSQNLTITGTPIRDIDALGGAELTHLDLSGSQHLQDLTPLTGMPLGVLHLSDCPRVTDFTPLAYTTITHLEIDGCTGVQDLGPLAALPLVNLRIDRQHVPALLGILHELPLLERISVPGESGPPTGFDPKAFWERFSLPENQPRLIPTDDADPPDADPGRPAPDEDGRTTP
ncbi:MAG: hypothetical protein ACOCXJ_00360, partial [Planctomycetota bacterium]